MQVISYSSDELKKLARIISDILAEAQKRRPELSTDEVVRRICALADHGERDIAKLRSAVLKKAA